MGKTWTSATTWTSAKAWTCAKAWQRVGGGFAPPKPPLRILRGLRPLKLPHFPTPPPWVGDGGGGDGGGDGDGRIFPEHPSPILHAPRDIISRKGKSLTPMWYMFGVLLH